MNSEIIRITALPVVYLEESRLRQTVEKVGMNSIDFESKEPIFNPEWYKVFL